MFCPKCGFEYREGYVICSDCGSPLVDDIDDGKKLYNIENKLVFALKKSHAYMLTIMNSDSVLKLASISYKMLCVSLALLSFFSLKIKTLMALGPGWEIPVDLVRPIYFFGQGTLITLLLCFILSILGYKRFRMQRKADKLILVIWSLSILAFMFAVDFRALSESTFNIIFDYGWISLTLPLLLVLHLIIQDHRVTYISKL